jgi:alpha-D-ribose 1-methylphosphonate 5-triphosphate diphosphatase
MTAERIFTNARVITADAEFLGTVVVDGDAIVAMDVGASGAPGAEDLDGDYLLPGCVELHTDNMEKHFRPRPGVGWPSTAAVVAHDAQMASSGITTVLDALRIGDFTEASELDNVSAEMARAIRAAQDRGAFRADHRIHVRCELAAPNLLEQFAAFAADPLVCLVSLMDHTPGQRQFVDVAKYRQYYQGKHGLTDAQMDAMIVEQRALQERHGDANRRALVEACRRLGLCVASHDDATEEHVMQAAEEGVVISEFPTTEAAAAAARRHDMKILMGAPNIVLGGSHSGNVSARRLSELDRLDILSSDYVPASLLHGVFMLTRGERGIALPDAVAKVSRNPAEAAGLSDRGEIAPGKRADLVRVRMVEDHPIVRAVWRGGERIV